LRDSLYGQKSKTPDKCPAFFFGGKFLDLIEWCFSNFELEAIYGLALRGFVGVEVSEVVRLLGGRRDCTDHERSDAEMKAAVAMRVRKSAGKRTERRKGYCLSVWVRILFPSSEHALLRRQPRYSPSARLP
jgi:hypothetical protein